MEELSKLNSPEEHDKVIVKKTGELLKEGIRAIEIKQKHIKIADWSELSLLSMRRVDSHWTRMMRNGFIGMRERRNGWTKGNVWEGKWCKEEGCCRRYGANAIRLQRTE